MPSLFRSVRRRLDAMPLWSVLLLDAAVLGLWLVDFRVPDEIPIDKVILGGVFVASALYAWRRVFGPPGTLSAAARRKVAEIELLFDECRKAAATIPGAAGEVARLSTLMSRVEAIEQRLEQAEALLLSPQYDVRAANGEVERLRAAVAGAAAGATRDNLAGALEEAEKHLGNIRKIEGTRDELSAAFERIYQLVRRIHSQIAGVGLAEGSGADDVGASVDDLANALAAYEKEQEALARAEKIAEKEIAEAEAAASAAVKAGKREDLH